MLLYLKGYVDIFNDIDLLIDEEDAAKAKACMDEIGQLQKLERNHYKAEHFYIFMVNGIEVDIMGTYFVEKDGVEYEIALEKDADIEFINLAGQSIPLDSIVRWRRHYDVMGRQSKVDIIDKGCFL